MSILAVVIGVLALYGALTLLSQLFGHRTVMRDPSIRFGGVVDTKADATLGYLPDELRKLEQRVLAARATA